MYSREMGGIRSDGQLYGMRPEELTAEIQRAEDRHSETMREHPREEAPPPPPPPPAPKRKGLLDLSFLHDLKIEDLLLLAIGFLLLTDNGEENNDLLIILIALLLLL